MIALSSAFLMTPEQHLQNPQLAEQHENVARAIERRRAACQGVSVARPPLRRNWAKNANYDVLGET